MMPSSHYDLHDVRHETLVFLDGYLQIWLEAIERQATDLLQACAPPRDHRSLERWLVEKSLQPLDRLVSGSAHIHDTQWLLIDASLRQLQYVGNLLARQSRGRPRIYRNSAQNFTLDGFSYPIDEATCQEAVPSDSMSSNARARKKTVT